MGKINVHYEPNQIMGKYFGSKENGTLSFSLQGNGIVVLLDKKIAPKLEGYYEIFEPSLIWLERCLILSGDKITPIEPIKVDRVQHKYPGVTFPVVKKNQWYGHDITVLLEIKDGVIVEKYNECICLFQKETNEPSLMSDECQKVFKMFQDGTLQNFLKTSLGSFYTSSEVELVEKYLHADTWSGDDQIWAFSVYRANGPVYSIRYKEHEKGVFSFECFLCNPNEDGNYIFREGWSISEVKDLAQVSEETTPSLFLDKQTSLTPHGYQTHTVCSPEAKKIIFSGTWNSKKYYFTKRIISGWSTYNLIK